MIFYSFSPKLVETISRKIVPSLYRQGYKFLLKRRERRNGFLLSGILILLLDSPIGISIADYQK